MKINNYFLLIELKKPDLRIKLINTLTKLCAHSTDGYDKTIEIFESYKVILFCLF